MIQSHASHIAEVETCGQESLQRSPIDRSPERRNHRGRNDEQRLGINTAGGGGPHTGGSIPVAEIKRQNQRAQLAPAEQGRLA